MNKNGLKQRLDELALSVSEYELITLQLGREPNSLELGLFGSLWSEHCGYKHSRPLLNMLPSHSPRLLVKPGEENAGAIDIGDGMAIVFKIESHNHPSAIEPYEGAATGVGGIVRDILAMGARPVALLNSLRFGPLGEPRNRHLFKRVVSGISDYGNCIGVPNVGGEISFGDSYSGNPLVNAMCVGVLERDALVRATTGSPNNVLMLVGAETGRDGIHGASGLASQTFENERELRPTVQVSNPFLEKILIEACLEAIDTGQVKGLQDLGAAGLTSATVEAASNGGGGVDINVEKVICREVGMTPYEVMLSESQERMLIIVDSEHVTEIQEIFDKWGLQSSSIGTSTANGNARIYKGSELCAEIPVETLTTPPQYRLAGSRPKRLDVLQNYDLGSVPLPDQDSSVLLMQLLKSPNIASKESVYRQYDHQVQTNTILGPGSDAAVLRIKGSSKRLAVSTDGNGRYCYLDPLMGGMIAVAEACRNVSCTGAEPIALTNCLNFGDPQKTETYYQMENCVKGMAEACEVLGVPIVSGNVSLYNETHGEAIYPTPVIGAVGLLEDDANPVNCGFKQSDDIVILLGTDSINEEVVSLSGSEYLEVIHELVVGSPTIDIHTELAVQRVCRLAANQNVIESAHDCSDGGLAVALVECCISGGIGFKATFDIPNRWDISLYGESQSRVIVSVRSRKRLSQLDRICSKQGISWTELGSVGGNSIRIPELMDVSITEVSSWWSRSIRSAATTNISK